MSDDTLIIQNDYGMIYVPPLEEILYPREYVRVSIKSYGSIKAFSIPITSESLQIFLAKDIQVKDFANIKLLKPICDFILDNRYKVGLEIYNCMSKELCNDCINFGRTIMTEIYNNGIDASNISAMLNDIIAFAKAYNLICCVNRKQYVYNINKFSFNNYPITSISPMTNINPNEVKKLSSELLKFADTIDTTVDELLTDMFYQDEQDMVHNRIITEYCNKLDKLYKNYVKEYIDVENYINS